MNRLLLALVLPLLALAQAPPPSAEQQHSLPDIKRQVGQKVQEAAEAELDLTAVLSVSGEPQRVRALETLEQILSGGPDLLALHVLTFAAYGPAPELENAVRQRLERLPEAGTNWTGNHLRFSAESYLAGRGDAACRAALLARLDDADPTLRARSYRLLRDTAEQAWATPAILEKLRTQAETEPDPAGRMAALAAHLANTAAAGEKSAVKETMETLARSGGARQKVRGELELALLEAKEGGPGLPAGRSADLLALARNGGHDERMFALEVLAKENDPQTAREIASWAESENWRDRLRSAFYLVLTKDSPEAARRLQTETNPMVQIALLSALAQQQTATPAKGTGQ